MSLKSGFAALGAGIAGAVMVGLYFALGVGWALIGVIAAVGLVSYVVAAVGARSRSSISAFGEIMRGWMIGQNTALNGLLGFSVGAAIGGTAAGVVFGLVVATVNFLSVFAVISQSEIYQGFVGYSNWLMPMSWLIVALGFLLYFVSFLLHACTAGKVEYLKIQALGMDWKTGTFFIRGGLISNLNYLDTAFNMGNFSFVDYKSGAWHKDHEAGHTLNLAVFGSIFHLIGAIDENATPRGANALSERLAESNATGVSGTNIPMWG